VETKHLYIKHPSSKASPFARGSARI